MLNQIRNSVYVKVLWALMGLHLLNISVDTADPYPQHIPEDLTINDQESIIEIIVEKILGYENAIEEYDDHDSEDHNKKQHNKTDLINRCKAGYSIRQSYAEFAKQDFPHFNAYLTNGFYQLDTPPPKI